MKAPDISNSTQEERETYIKNKFRCLSDCDMCGICAAFHGQSPELAYRDYIAGTKDFGEVSAMIRSH